MRFEWRILAPVDLAQCTAEPVEHAVAVAAAFAADLDLLSVSAPGSPPAEASTEWPQSAWGHSDRAVDIHRWVLEGPVAPAIAAQADSISADFVLMTSQRFGSWRRLRRRSVTEEVLKHSSRPVCITSQPNIDRDYRLRSRRILCVTGLDGCDTELLHWSREIVLRTGAEVTLLHVLPDAGEGLLAYGLDRGTQPLSVPRAEQQIGELADQFRVPVTTSVMVGDPARCISLVAQAQGADLVLISRAHAQSRPAYATDIESIVRRLRCPLLTIPVNTRQPSHQSDRMLSSRSRLIAATSW